MSPLQELVRVSEELGLHDVLPEVCTAHMRYTPCRKGSEESPCVFSSDPGDMRKVREYHRM